MGEKLTIEFPSQGWKQFLTTRRQMLDAYDRARERAKSHEVEVYHGQVAEAEVRKWLSAFLPKRFGVTSGYVVSPGLKHNQKTPHYDVIIYDVQNSPVLWIEDDPDRSEQGRSRAIPVEPVQCVLEVKAKFSSSTAAAAMDHLADLLPLMSGVDDQKERYKLHLSAGFVCGLIFFELDKKDEFSAAALKKVLEGFLLRNFFGGIILRGEGHDRPLAGKLRLVHGAIPIEDRERHSMLDPSFRVESIALSDDFHISVMLDWMQTNFSQFGFDLIAVLQGTYEKGKVSSWFGLG